MNYVYPQLQKLNYMTVTHIHYYTPYIYPRNTLVHNLFSHITQPLTRRAKNAQECAKQAPIACRAADELA